LVRKQRDTSPSFRPPAKGDLLFSNEIDSDAEQAGSTSNKSQWSVEVSISSSPSARI